MILFNEVIASKSFQNTYFGSLFSKDKVIILKIYGPAHFT